MNSGRVNNLINRINLIDKQSSLKEQIRSSISETKKIRIQDIFAPQDQAANILTEENSFTASARFKESSEKIMDITNTIDIATRSNRVVHVNIKPREYAKTYMYKTINSHNSKSIQNQNYVKLFPFRN